MSYRLQYSSVGEIYQSSGVLRNVVQSDQILRDQLDKERVVVMVGIRDDSHVYRPLRLILAFALPLGVGVKLLEAVLHLLVLVKYSAPTLTVEWHDAV